MVTKKKVFINSEKPSLEEVVKEYLPTIKYWANRYAYQCNPVLSKEDLVSAGVIGLIEAYQRYDPKKRVKFKTFAEIRIRGAILDEIRKLDIIPRSVRDKISKLEEKIQEFNEKFGRMPTEEDLAKSMGMTLEEYYKFLDQIKGITFIDINTLKQKIPDLEEEDIFEFIAGEDKEQPFEKYALKELQEKLEKALSYLDEKERLVLALYYYEGLNMKEIAKVLNYSEGRISQIHNQAILKLRSFFKEKNQKTKNQKTKKGG